MKTIVYVIFLILFLSPVFANDNSLAFSAMQTKYISLDLTIESPIYFSNYGTNDEFTFKTSIFSSNRTQTAEIEAYYLDDSENKIFAEIVTENDNRYAIFKVKPITRDTYKFYVSGAIVSENKIVLNNIIYDLTNEISEEAEYKAPSKFIQSDSLEIKAIAKHLQTSNDALENLVNVTNWVHDYVEYDFDYVPVVNDSKKVLADGKGVCDEISILAGAILRAQGYPVKYIVGYANTSQEWGPHAWLEVYIPNQGWIPVDPTYNEVGFVDSSHIVLEKLKDPVESKDSISSTSNINVTFGEKRETFIHKETKSYNDYGYGDVVTLFTEFKKDNLSNSPFNAKLNLSNTTPNPIILLVVTQINSEFNQIYPKSRKKLYYLKPFENKSADYFFILPKVDRAYSFSFDYISQFNEYGDSVNVHKDRGIYEELFLTSEPVLYFRDNYFYFEQDFFNYTNKDKNITFNFNYDGEEINDQKIITSQTESKYTKKFDVVEDVNFNYLISGDYSFSGNTFFYKEEEITPNFLIKQEIDSNFVDVNEYDKLFDKLENKKIDNKSEFNYFIVVLIALFFIFILFLFISKSLKKQGVQ